MTQDKALAPFAEATYLNVKGQVYTDFANDERFIAATSVSAAGTGCITPLTMNTLAVGGSDWNYDPSALTGQRGITAASGLNNIGRLVSVCGRFAYVNHSSFVVSDGSGAPIKCVVPAGVAINPGWTHLYVTGISSCEKAGDKLQPLLLVRQQADIVALQ